MKRYIVGLAVAVAAIGTTVFSVSASAAPKADTILVGISAAKTGILGPYDLQAGQLFQLRIEQLNKAGGVLGKQIKVKWIDTKSDKPTAATNASELISQGAVAILTTCDFDFSFPATQAEGSKKVLGSASARPRPRLPRPRSSVSTAARWARIGRRGRRDGGVVPRAQADLKRAWIVKDLSLEYSKATADYFKARWKQLGGTVCGEDTFTAGDNLDLSANTTRLRGAVSKCDVIYDGSWNPFGAQFVRAVRDAGIKTTIITNASVNGLPVVQNNPKLSNFYALGFACLNTYCTGSKNPEVAKVNAAFKAKYGQPIGNHYALPGYELADALVAAIKKAGSTDGTKLSSALYDSGLKIKTFAGPMAFTKKCHRPQAAIFTVEQYTNGKDKQIDTVSVKKVPSIGDGSPCSGNQPAQVTRHGTTNSTIDHDRRRPQARAAGRGADPRPLRRRQGRRRSRSDARSGRDHGLDRAERRGQDDVHERRLEFVPRTSGRVILGASDVTSWPRIASPRPGSCARSRTSRRFPN